MSHPARLLASTSQSIGSGSAIAWHILRDICLLIHLSLLRYLHERRIELLLRKNWCCLLLRGNLPMFQRSWWLRLCRWCWVWWWPLCFLWLCCCLSYGYYINDIVIRQGSSWAKEVKMKRKTTFYVIPIPQRTRGGFFVHWHGLRACPRSGGGSNTIQLIFYHMSYLS